MARFLPNSLLGDIRGSVGGLTFRGGRTGTVVSSRALNKYHDTPRGVEHTRFLTETSIAWRDMSPSLKLGWETYAATDLSIVQAFGITKKLTAREVFFRWYLAHRHLHQQPNISVLPTAPLFISADFESRFYWSHHGVSSQTFFGQCHCASTAAYWLGYIAVWVNWPATTSQLKSRHWHKILPRIGDPATRLAYQIDTDIWDQVGKPKEFWNVAPGHHLEQYVPWVRGYCSMHQYHAPPPHSYPLTTIGVVRPRLWRQHTHIEAWSIPQWPQPLEYVLDDPPPTPAYLYDD